MIPKASDLRAAILAAQLETSNFGETPDAATLYVPPSHLKALRLDAQVIVGGRGVGKSFWTSVLQSDALRGLLETAASDLAGVTVRLGFGEKENIDAYPNADVFSRFIDQGDDPYDLWRAVILRWVAEKSELTLPSESWSATVAWLKDKPEEAAKLMQRRGDWRGLIVFDALDRTSYVWQRMDEIVRGLLRAVLWLKPFQGLHAKVFLREDQAERTVFNFPDASKLTATKAELTWARHDLHGLLWQRLINAPGTHGKHMRRICPHVERSGFWRVADEMKIESSAQRKAFECLAGPWMGRDRRRGVPYTWSVSHLADGQGRTSPRSFLAAIRQAAEDSAQRYPEHEYALHYESIKRGIQKASAIRVQEMAEDYPWVPVILSELKGLNVPVEFEVIRAKWADKYPDGPQSIPSDRLPAQHSARGWEGIREDLQRLGLIETKRDGRIDMPDLYRVGFGLGRKGGVKPTRS
ncbi:hypothetical protein [Tepidiphilus baoligensis]|uniref:Uncharacterized protein n=1 Tax=Tepidiphilus baoligensis TaxID=2698687 RepID=A0ABX1QQD5_9PROT|nr:hypothetical protein [Tepidiphilus baoligensis]NMH17546.1 hypothetical protein [Tepidiphilus baoligensis]